MVSDASAIARDFLYGGSLLIGLSVGTVSQLIFPGRAAHRPHLAALSSALSACAVLSFCASLIWGSFGVFQDLRIVSVALIFFLLAVLGGLLPRQVGFPFLVALGSAAVLFSWTYLVFPKASEGSLLGRIRIGSSGESRFWFESNVAPDLVFSVSDPALLRFGVLLIDFDRRIPLIGGTSRVAVQELRLESRSLGARPRRSLFELSGDLDGRIFFSVPGIVGERRSFDSPGSASLLGGRRDILWSGGRLLFSEWSGIK